MALFPPVLPRYLHSKTLQQVDREQTLDKLTPSKIFNKSQEMNTKTLDKIPQTA